MSTNQITAVDDILSVAKAAAESAGVSTILYDNDDKPVPTDTSTWIRARVQHNVAPQRTIGEVGTRIFEQFGILTIQVFVKSGTGREDTVSSALVAALAGLRTPNGVVFDEPTPREIGNEGNWYQVNVVAGFRYNRLS